MSNEDVEDDDMYSVSQLCDAVEGLEGSLFTSRNSINLTQSHHANNQTGPCNENPPQVDGFLIPLEDLEMSIVDQNGNLHDLVAGESAYPNTSQELVDDPASLNISPPSHDNVLCFNNQMFLEICDNSLTLDVDLENKVDCDKIESVTEKLVTIGVETSTPPICDTSCSVLVTEEVKNIYKIHRDYSTNSLSNDDVVAQDDSFHDGSNAHQLNEGIYEVQASETDENALAGDACRLDENPSADSAPSISRNRKTLPHPEHWNRNREKTKRLHGEPYIGFRRAGKGSTKKVLHDVPRDGRVMGPPCDSPQCRKWESRACNSVTPEERHQIFDDFWRVMSWDSKKMYICSTVTVKETKQHTKTKGASSRRASSFFYHLQIQGRRIPVCREMYLRTLGVKRSEVHYWIKHYSENNVPRAVNRQAQEQQQSRQKNDESSDDATNESPLPAPMKKKEAFKLQAELLSQFFDSLPVLPSHYCRKNSRKQFLQTDIRSWNQLYLLYKSKCNEDKKQPVSFFSFLRMKDEKNLSIHMPKKDRCDTCSSYELKNVSEKVYQVHQMKKEAVRQEKEKDKASASMGACHVLCVDLMMVQPLPRLKASSAYYKLKLTGHCYTVYNMTTRDSMAYWFDETHATLNATTFASCIRDYLDELIAESPKTVILYSDGCSYQNRNAVLSNALLHLSMLRNVTIIQKYLEKGHTQMECDSVHSTIERHIKHTDIHLTSQYAALTRTARKIPMAYRAKTLDHQFTRDYGIEDSLIYHSIRPGKKKGDPTVTDLRWIQYEPSGKILFKLDFTDELKELSIRPRKLSSRESFPILHLSRSTIPLDKWQDLQSLKCLMPSDTHDFYNNIPHECESKRALKRQKTKK